MFIITLFIIAIIGALVLLYFNQNKKNQDYFKKSPEIGNIDVLFEDDEKPQLAAPSTPRVKKEGFRLKRRTPKISKESEELQNKAGPQLNQDVLILYVKAKREAFTGYVLLQALLSQGLRFGAMNIFHKYENTDKGEIVFSVAQSHEPGVFDIEKMGDVKSDGLCLFMQLKGEESDTKAFKIMLNAANNLATSLNGVLLASNKEPFDKTSIIDYRKKLQVAQVDATF